MFCWIQISNEKNHAFELIAMALDQVTEYSKFLIYQMKDLDSTHAKMFRESSAILKNNSLSTEFIPFSTKFYKEEYLFRSENHCYGNTTNWYAA